MPGFDGTGPMGQGSMTGRGMGYCVVPVGPTASAPAPVTPAVAPYYPAVSAYGLPRVGYPRFGRWPRFGYGRGFGRGGGRGRGGRGRRW